MMTLKTPGLRPRLGKIAIAALVLFLDCPRAEAHLVTTGLGPVYDGVAHLVLSPADMALVVGVALLAAMRGARQGRWLLVLLPTAWLAGGVIGMLFPVIQSLNWLTGLAFLVAGGLVAADRNLPLLVVSALVMTLGAFLGFLTGSALSAAPSAGLEMIGEGVSLIVIVTLVAGLVVSLKSFWSRIVVRVLGSWIAATGLLLIGWSFRVGG